MKGSEEVQRHKEEVLRCLKEYSNDFWRHVHKDPISTFSVLLLRIFLFVKGRKVTFFRGLGPQEKDIAEESKNIKDQKLRIESICGWASPHKQVVN